MTAITLMKLLPGLISWGRAKTVHHRPQVKKASAALLFLFSAAVGLGTVVVLFFPQPEIVRAVSSDHRVQLTGRAGNERVVSIERRQDVVGPFTAVVGPVYDLRMEKTAGGETFQLTFSYDAADVQETPLEDFAWMHYDTRLGAWAASPSVVDSATHTVRTEIGSFESGWWTLGKLSAVSPPTSLPLIVDELTEMPPRNAVGYQAFVSYAKVPGDFVLIDAAVRRGGCAGRFKNGDARTLTSQDLSQGPLTYRIGVLWELGEGCTAAASLAAER